MNINNCISSISCRIALAQKEGERTWLKSYPQDLLIVDARTTELGIVQVLISGLRGKVWMNLLDSDIVFNAFEKNGSPITLKEFHQL